MFLNFQMAQTYFSLVFSTFALAAFAKDFDLKYVTCGSTLKLINTGSGVRLHSHEVMYGSGSGQQSVTAVDSADDNNSYWIVKGVPGENCIRGEAVRCGQTIRLTHMATQRNLHSHNYQSPLSYNLEVSAYGENGEGNEEHFTFRNQAPRDGLLIKNDNWIVECKSAEWSRNQKIHLKHVSTQHYLHVSGDMYGMPIQGQLEVSGYPASSDLNSWAAAEGIFIKPSLPLHSEIHHTEL